MYRFRLVTGAILLAILFFAVTALKTTSETPEMAIATFVPSVSIAEQQKAEALARQQQVLEQALSTYFQRAIASGDIIGAGVSVVKGDAIVIADGFGRRSIKGNAKVDGETVFRLGSLSKGFAGVLAADLEAEGKFNFNDKVSDYVPGFQFGDQTNTNKVKIAHILSHTSGTPYHSFTNLVEAGLPMEKIATRFNEVKPLNEPGVQYSYQNAMFAVSQEVMLKATGKNINALLENRFFKPLGMATISMDHNSLTEIENVALPHSRGRRGWRTLPLRNRYYNAVAAGGINASSSDMGKWMRFLLGHNPEVLPAKTIQKAFTPFIALNHNNKYYQRWPNHQKSHYAFGWRIHQFEANTRSNTMTVWHHGGSVNNYRNEIALFPEEDLGICVLLNGQSRLAKTVIPDLYQIVKEVYAKTDVKSSTKAIADLEFEDN